MAGLWETCWAMTSIKSRQFVQGKVYRMKDDASSSIFKSCGSGRGRKCTRTHCGHISNRCPFVYVSISTSTYLAFYLRYLFALLSSYE